MALAYRPLLIAGREFGSRLLVGTGKFNSPEMMRDALAASGCEVVTVAVRRERLYDSELGRLADTTPQQERRP